MESAMSFKVCAFVVVAALGVVGCAKPQVATQGSRGIEATYSLGTLKATLPMEATVPAVIAAADQSARARGYTVVTSTATDDRGRLVCRPPRSDSFPRVVVVAFRMSTGTKVTIEMQPMGDQDLCRSMLDAMLQQLGM
jgi:hypothetical protein